MNSINYYVTTLDKVKKRIRDAQAKAILSVNSEMISMYWDIGEIIYNRKKKKVGVQKPFSNYQKIFIMKSLK